MAAAFVWPAKVLIKEELQGTHHSPVTMWIFLYASNPAHAISCSPCFSRHHASKFCIAKSGLMAVLWIVHQLWLPHVNPSSTLKLNKCEWLKTSVCACRAVDFILYKYMTHLIDLSFVHPQWQSLSRVIQTTSTASNVTLFWINTFGEIQGNFEKQSLVIQIINRWIGQEETLQFTQQEQYSKLKKKGCLYL